MRPVLLSRTQGESEIAYTPFNWNYKRIIIAIIACDNKQRTTLYVCVCVFPNGEQQFQYAPSRVKVLGFVCVCVHSTGRVGFKAGNTYATRPSR